MKKYNACEICGNAVTCSGTYIFVGKKAERRMLVHRSCLNNLVKAYSTSVEV